MSFIVEPTVVNIKLTDIGRQLLSRGELTFDQYAVGDSEIDYEFNNEANLNAENAAILRPIDNNPNIVSFVPRQSGGDNFQSLGTVVSNTSVISNTAPVRGFFSESGGVFTIKTDTNLAKQSDIAIQLSTADGTTTATLRQASTYGANPTEPVEGDYIIVKWGNPDLGDVSGFDVDTNVPYIWYKIEEITSGSLAGDNLVVELDKPQPNFNGSGGGVFASAVLYPNSNNRNISGDSIQTYYGSPFITDFVSESVISFIENCDVPTIDVPIWNMAIIFTKDVEGIQVNDKNISNFFTKIFGGFVQYIQRVSPTVEKIGLIHYTNNSPSNNYGEGLIQGTPRLDLPTIMWHKKSDGRIGLTLTPDTPVLTLSGLNTTYQDLLDPDGNVVGKVFLDLKVFVIEDQELIYAMSYKSNRSWTLPAVNVGINTSNCPTGDVQITGTVTL